VASQQPRSGKLILSSKTGQEVVEAAKLEAGALTLTTLAGATNIWSQRVKLMPQLRYLSIELINGEITLLEYMFLTHKR
jgi:hypothetical protein